jgi:tRNA pseudouridine55 synthase
MMEQLKGILPLLKPTGFTSHDCVNKMRRILKTKKIGHTGTLDPSVTGVLPLCVGQATRVADYLHDLPKEYEGILVLGQSTTTEDADGEIIESKKVSCLDKEQVEAVIMSFLGEIQQIPPMYSAVKINGTRLHELARKGLEVERKPRTVTIYDIRILSMEMDKELPEIKFWVKCSKGTYVRTLCVDIGKRLGFPSHMRSLIRTKSGPFSFADCYTFEQVEEAVNAGEITQLLKPLDMALLHYPKWMVSEEQAKDIWNGKSIRLEGEWKPDQLLRIYSIDSGFLAIYRVVLIGKEFWAKPEKVFHGEGGDNGN